METKTEFKGRRGDPEKCPVCGSRVDPEAYCCPTCRSYFCYHCRARVLESDPQFQCVNKGCDYYGRLVCANCDPRHEREEPPSVYFEPEDGFWLLLLLLALVGGLFAWVRWGLTWPWVLVVMAAVFAAGALVVRLCKRSVFGRNVRVEQQRITVYHTCIACEKEARTLVDEY
jgi:hypothetical protein